VFRDPEDELALVSAFHAGRQQIDAGSFSGVVIVTRRSKWCSRGLSVSLPRGCLAAEILRSFSWTQPPAEVLDLDLARIDALRFPLEIRFDVLDQLADVDFLGLEVDLCGVAENELQLGSLACGLVIVDSNRPQLPTIWSRRFRFQSFPRRRTGRCSASSTRRLCRTGDGSRKSGPAY